MFDWNLNLNLELEGRTRPTPATNKGAFRGAESGIQRHVCLFVYHVNTDLKRRRELLVILHISTWVIQIMAGPNSRAA
jgi:hypothetical protein